MHSKENEVHSLKDVRIFDISTKYLTKMENPLDYLIHVPDNSQFRIVHSFKYKNVLYHIAAVGVPLERVPSVMYFPELYILNTETKSSIMMTNMMKYGASEIVIKNDQIRIYGDSGGQCMQWDVHSVETGEYLGFLDNDGVLDSSGVIDDDNDF